MTRAATEFVGAVTFEALTGRPVHTELFDPGHALDHITLARASARDRRRAGDGRLPGARRRRDRPTTCSPPACLPPTCPVLLVPAMNDRMWAHPQTQRNVRHLRELGYHVLDAGRRACSRRARAAARAACRNPRRSSRTWGACSRRAGRSPASASSSPPDRRARRSTRCDSSPTTAAARWAWRSPPPPGGAGPTWTLVAGPLVGRASVGPRGAPVETTGRDGGRGAARAGRRRRAGDGGGAGRLPPGARRRRPRSRRAPRPPTLALDATPDILAATRSARRPGARHRRLRARDRTTSLANATRESSTTKELDLIVVNDATEPGAGFGVDTNRVTLLDRAGGRDALPLMPKTAVADAILDRVEGLLGGR